MFDIDDEDIFIKVHKYEIHRNDGCLLIDLHEVVAGKSPHKFTAIPKLSVVRAEKEYFGVGDTERAALEDCLSRIKGVPIEVIVPPPK